jgi:DNA adenine methylase
MRYQGSKAKVVKDIVRRLDVQPGALYVEPFVGGGNVIAHVTPEATRVGYDANIYMVALLRSLALGWVPPKHVTEEEYRRVKENRHRYEHALVGYVGTQASFGGCWFGGYARAYKPDRTPRDMPHEAWKNTMRQAPLLRGCTFLQSDYRDIRFGRPAIIYCDPPYDCSTGYDEAGAFDSAEFWRWARGLDPSHTVFVSEYAAPEGWRCVWSKEVDGFNSYRKDRDVERKRPTEKLFVRDL